METPVNESAVLIIGAGTWGFSIALQLARRGFTGIKVLDASSFPSSSAAGNDLNKIAEEANEPSDDDSDEDYFWNKVHQLSMETWKNDPLFKPFYHATGFIMAACGDRAYEHCLKYAKSEQADLIPLKSKEHFRSTMPKGVLTGSFPQWRGFWKDGGAGWVFASGALREMYAEAVKLGVHFMTGSSEGAVQTLLQSSSKDTIIGAQTADGVRHKASLTILATGANSDSLLDFKKQLRPTAWTLAHLPLAAEEIENYRNLPVLYGVDRGFFIEPDAENHQMKICDEHPGYCNFIDVEGELRSVPFARQQIPKDAERRMRRLLKETMPQFEQRDFSFARICWDADTVDRLFLIDWHPELKNLVIAVGGSGHGFMTNPAVGILVADVVENKVEERLKRMMRWRPKTSVHRNWWDTQNRFGADGKVMDFQDVQEWTTIGEGEKGDLCT
ncbi:nucleotide-binding domain-containing protein [Zopfia rhizophila CBS 207.26]|uniref:Nucleotide-binding domain-containing protein n=1 Tax=Zopfia rhizophila CBS 207.26 TaxID=1314779 RepID=A0A6A6DD33_9PEZI|nr:nucleotide-binding domain-containing protein [Zopfia rhizophila CBS 207.26]